MNKKFINIWFIWHAGMKTAKTGLSCQINKHLAWTTPNSRKGSFHYSALYHATCQTCQMFKRKIVNTPQKTTFWAKTRLVSGMMGGDIQALIRWEGLYIPPQEAKL